ncbi:hypothetical protein NK356_09535 [Chryseobacterium sp. S0630]|uniref:HD domain-containing protein n=1 Tax=Chryseobacterium sp. S0630 TaxID=2957803 RepID=UPI00209DCCFE|nr:hypothetical protein [Chryseobacterium sp. S0630]MCP1299407.1 hypothetical protein [Chryseobacterium sp. S0630]
MAGNIKNIENEFISLKDRLDDFPLGKNYINKYEEFKDKFKDEIHPEIKTRILEIEKEGYYNDHGIDHINMVIERATRLLNNLNITFIRDEEGFYLSPYELFILLMAIQLHDAGHLIATRSEHAEKGKELLAKFDSGRSLSTAERMHIGNIAKAHGGKKDPIGALPLQENISHQKIRPQFLAAILRLADELAEDKSRASNFLLNIGAITPTSEIFHRYSAALESITISGGELKLDFYIQDEFLLKMFPIKTKSGIIDKYLLDEIYDRTFKTFTEALYCSRFLPEKARITIVKVNIHILKSKNDDEIKNIYYELKETGYPFISDQDIYDLCESLKENELKINGEFIKNFIEQLSDYESIRS